MTNLKIVVMSSGGVDSSMLMLLLKKRNHDVFPLHINYGHLAEEREWLACKNVCMSLDIREPIRIDVSGMRQIPSGLTNSSLHIEKDAFLPTRNLLFATIGAAYAFSISSCVVSMGILANPIFPDQTPEFVKAAEDCISIAIGIRIKILTPFIKLDKQDILRLARKHGLPLDMTYHCHSGREKPCGICISCKERISAERSLLLSEHIKD